MEELLYDINNGSDVTNPFVVGESPNRLQVHSMRSMKQITTLVVISVGLLSLMGCNFGAPISKSSNVTTSATATVAQREKNVRSTSSPTAIATQAVSKGVESIAPPYEEIKRTIIQIVYGDEQGEGPEMGDDGIVDPKIGEVFGNYNVFLRGRKVEDWEGWVESFTQSNLGDPQTGYNLGVYMQEPEPGEIQYDGLDLLHVPREQVEKLQLQVNLDQGFAILKTAWPRVRFSGTIVGIFHNGGILIEDVTIDRLE